MVQKKWTYCRHTMNMLNTKFDNKWTYENQQFISGILLETKKKEKKMFLKQILTQVNTTKSS